jgi:hypothetical protein
MKKYIIFFLLILFITCSKNIEEEFERLELKAKDAIQKQDLNKIVDILEDLEALEKQETEKKIIQLDNIRKNSIYYLTPSKKFFLFSKEEMIYLYYKDKIVSTSLSKPHEIFSSYSGMYYIFRYKTNDKTCRDQVYRLDIDAKQEDFTFVLLEENINNCNNVVITDLGNLYIEINQEVYLINKTNKILKIASAQLRKIFKKNPHTIHFVPLPDKGFWIFYGNAGYYDLYYYDEKGLRFLQKNIAKPTVYYATEDLFVEDKAPEHYYFVFMGAAGQYTLTGFQLPDTLWKSFNVKFNDRYVYIKKQNLFLLRKEDNLFFLNPETDKEIQIPIKSKDYYVYDGSLILLKEDGLFVRKEPFNNLEKKMFVLKEELLYNIR